MFNSQDEEHLRFYFSEAMGAVGLRCPLGIQLEKLFALHVPGMRGSQRCRAPKRYRQVSMSDDSLDQAGLEAALLAGHIGRVIASLDGEYQTVLKLHYSEPAHINLNTKDRDEHLILRDSGISMSLACGTEAALCGYTAFQCKGRTMPGATLGMSIERWLIWIILRSKRDPRSKEAVEHIVVQGRDALHKARNAYARAKEQAA